MKFGLIDYYRMWRRRGIRLPIAYFLNTHLFDIRNGTDTHVWLPKESYPDRPKNFEHGVLYMCSWTNTVEESTQKALDILSIAQEHAILMDIGCGKGKVVCVWSKRFPRAIKIIGIDYSSALIRICKENLSIISAKSVEIINADATEYDYESELPQGPKIMYLYNPFDAQIILGFLKKVNSVASIIIYNNPLHGEVLVENGFKRIYKRRGWHQNANYDIFINERNELINE